MSNIGLSDKESSFLMKWARIRNKGKLRYVITRGIALGLLLFLIWLAVTVIEISMSEFQKALYFEHTSNFIIKCVIWFVCYFVLGIIFATGIWKRKEEKWDHLSSARQLRG